MDKQLQAAKSVRMEQENTGSLWKFHYFPLSVFSCFTTLVFTNSFCNALNGTELLVFGKILEGANIRTVVITGLVEI